MAVNKQRQQSRMLHMTAAITLTAIQLNTSKLRSQCVLLRRNGHNLSKQDPLGVWDLAQ
jgi:hypothetical protein